MTVFHLPTAYLIAGLMYLLMPMAVWLFLKAQKTTSIALWCGGSEVLGASLVLFALRNVIPDWMTYSLANFMLYAGVLMRVESLRVEWGRPVQHLRWPLVAMLFLAVYEFCRVVLVQPYLHFVWSIGLTGILFAWQSWLALQIARRDRSQGAWWLAIIYLPVTLALLVRAAMVMLSGTLPGPLAPDWSSLGVILFAVLSAVIGHIGFLGLHVERAIRREMVMVAAKAKLEESVILGQQIAQLDRVKSVGQISVSLAHELSQPLTNITLLLQCAQIEVAQIQNPDSALPGYLNDLEKNTHSVQEILQRIRNFLKAKEVQYTYTSLRAVAQDVADLLRDWMLSQGVQLHFHFPDRDVFVMGDSVQLSQILMNVYRNAIEATVGQSLRQMDVTIRSDGQFAIVQITDNGPGLTPEVADKISTAFFSTKPDGLGVGLSISQSIAQQHGGTLTIANGSGASVGAVVTLTLPLAQ
jgi:signal transduction histidine kinase